MTDKGEYIENLKEKHIQTCIPPIDGRVMILKGEHKGK